MFSFFPTVSKGDQGAAGPISLTNNYCAPGEEMRDAASDLSQGQSVGRGAVPTQALLAERERGEARAWGVGGRRPPETASWSLPLPIRLHYSFQGPDHAPSRARALPFPHFRGWETETSSIGEVGRCETARPRSPDKRAGRRHWDSPAPGLARAIIPARRG